MRTAAASVALSWLAAAAAVAGPDEVRVDLPLGPYVRPGRPLCVRVAGGADRVRAPDTAWALPMGDAGDEFVLRMPDVVASPVPLTVERDGAATVVRLALSVLPADGPVVALVGDVAAPPGAAVVRVPSAGLPTVAAAWVLVDDVAGDLRALAPADRDRASGGRVGDAGIFGPLMLPPDPKAFAAVAEAAALSPRLAPGAAVVLLVAAGAEVLVVLLLAMRRDRPWVRAAWIAAPALAAAAYVAAECPPGAALRAVPLAVEGDRKAVYVLVEALRDGEGTLVLPDDAHKALAALVRFSADDASLEGVSLGSEVRLSMRAGETRVIAYATPHEKGVALFGVGVGGSPARAGPRIEDWLRSHGLEAEEAWTCVHPRSLPAGRGVAVLPGLHVRVRDLPPAK